MINLIGQKKINDIIIEELNEAQITIIQLKRKPRYKLSKIYGEKNGFTFEREDTYWIIEGYMPIDIAKEIYDKHKNVDIKINGYESSYNPTERYIDLVNNSQLEYNDIPKDKLDDYAWANKIDNEYYITKYRIETQEGLNIISNYINNLRVGYKVNMKSEVKNIDLNSNIIEL